MSELCDQTAIDLRRMIGAKEISPVDLVESCIARTEAVDPAVNAMVTPVFERAREEAANAEQAVMDGDELGLLHGLPVGVKDLEATGGVRTTYGSLIYENHVPEEDQLSVANVRAEGGIVLGKTNTPEFGAGANTKNRVFGATGNPFNPDLSCAGSSGGSAVSLACSMVSVATGSDFGGSLRTPASFCGVVGFRPSPGVVPVEGRPVALTPLSVNGPMGRTVADAALLLAAQTDADIRDPFSSAIDVDLLNPLGQLDLSSIRVAISPDLGCAPVDNNIREKFTEKTNAFRHVFADADDRDPDLSDVHQVFEILRGVNFTAAHHERLKNHRDLLGPNVIDNVTRALEFSLADVAWAHAEQSNIYRRFLSFFDDVDILICPTAAVSPYPHEQLSVMEINGETMPTYMRWLALSYGLTMALPAACSIPVGVDHKGMPFGIQIVGPNGSDRFVLEVAHALETYLAGNADLARPQPDIAKLTELSK
jgi:amidase